MSKKDAKEGGKGEDNFWAKPVRVSRAVLASFQKREIVTTQNQKVGLDGIIANSLKLIEEGNISEGERTLLLHLGQIDLNAWLDLKISEKIAGFFDEWDKLSIHSAPEAREKFATRLKIDQLMMRVVFSACTRIEGTNEKTGKPIHEFVAQFLLMLLDPDYEVVNQMRVQIYTGALERGNEKIAIFWFHKLNKHLKSTLDLANYTPEGVDLLSGYTTSTGRGTNYLEGLAKALAETLSVDLGSLSRSVLGMAENYVASPTVYMYAQMVVQLATTMRASSMGEDERKQIFKDVASDIKKGADLALEKSPRDQIESVRKVLYLWLGVNGLYFPELIFAFGQLIYPDGGERVREEVADVPLFLPNPTSPVGQQIASFFGLSGLPNRVDESATKITPRVLHRIATAALKDLPASLGHEIGQENLLVTLRLVLQVIRKLGPGKAVLPELIVACMLTQVLIQNKPEPAEDGQSKRPDTTSETLDDLILELSTLINSLYSQSNSGIVTHPTTGQVVRSSIDEFLELMNASIRTLVNVGHASRAQALWQSVLAKIFEARGDAHLPLSRIEGAIGQAAITDGVFMRATRTPILEKILAKLCYPKTIRKTLGIDAKELYDYVLLESAFDFLVKLVVNNHPGFPSYTDDPDSTDNRVSSLSLPLVLFAEVLVDQSSSTAINDETQLQQTIGLARALSRSMLTVHQISPDFNTFGTRLVSELQSVLGPNGILETDLKQKIELVEAELVTVNAMYSKAERKLQKKIEKLKERHPQLPFEQFTGAISQISQPLTVTTGQVDFRGLVDAYHSVLEIDPSNAVLSAQKTLVRTNLSRLQTNFVASARELSKVIEKKRKIELELALLPRKLSDLTTALKDF